MRTEPIKLRGEPEFLRAMFADPNDRRLADLPINYSTDPQAEVLVSMVPPQYIKKVHFHSNNAKGTWVRKNPNVVGFGQDQFRTEQTYLLPRMDWKVWKSKQFSGEMIDDDYDPFGDE